MTKFTISDAHDELQWLEKNGFSAFIRYGANDDGSDLFGYEVDFTKSVRRNGYTHARAQALDEAFRNDAGVRSQVIRAMKEPAPIPDDFPAEADFAEIPF